MTIIYSPILRQALSEIPDDVRREVDLSYGIADRIAAILKREKMTQKEFARRLGKSEPEVSAWLAGGHNFTIRTLARISSVLGTDIVSISHDNCSSTQE